MKFKLITSIAACTALMSLSGCIVLPPNSNPGAATHLEPQIPMGHNGVYSPMPGIICDRKAGFCADSYGISVGLTKEYLGATAEKSLLAMGSFDMSSFVLSDGVACNVKTQTCTVAKFSTTPDTAHTKALFEK